MCAVSKILVLGGYGNFGRLICEGLAARRDIELIIAGRHDHPASQLVAALEQHGANCKLSTLVLDVFSETLHRVLSDLRPQVVIHTSGPFQNQDYYVPRTCLEDGCHYIDLADDRKFVCDFHTLNDLAESTGSIAISGASTVPGLSSVVIDTYRKEFNQLESIDFFILPGSNVELGEATLRGILSYLGNPFKGWHNNKFIDLYGWLDNRRLDFGAALGKRWSANVDIPDLELFPGRYSGVNSVRFQAGHELTIVHMSLAVMGLIAKVKLVKRWDRFTKTFYKIGKLMKPLGSDLGGMVIKLTGKNNSGHNQAMIWRCLAPRGKGPYIPTFSALILAEMLLDKQLKKPMAVPCLGMYKLDKFTELANKFGIYQEVERTSG